jgi:hypothetical protein
MKKWIQRRRTSLPYGIPTIPKAACQSLPTSFATSLGERRRGMALEDVRAEKISFAGEIALKSL